MATYLCASIDAALRRRPFKQCYAKRTETMTDQKDYSFSLAPGGKTRYIAGAIDYEKRTPHYDIDISVPQHVRDQVEVKQFLLGSPQNCQLGWDIHNKSSWPALVVVRKDGVLLKIS